MLKRGSICFALGGGIVFFILAIKGFSLRIEVLSDAFSTAGLLMIFFAGLSLVNNEGVFLGIGYALKNALCLFIPALGNRGETYTQYRQRKIEKEGAKGQGTLFLVGIFFLGMGVLFLMIWWKLFSGV
jgi:hypothetical protein